MSDAPLFIQVAVYFNGNIIQKSSFPIREIFIGRSNDCDIILDNAGVSRHHAKIALQNDQIAITDLESGNGTFVGDQAITEALLGAGDSIRIAKFTIKAELTDTPVEDAQAYSQSNDVIEQNAHRTVFLSPEERQQILKHSATATTQITALRKSSTNTTESPKGQTPWMFFAGGIAVGLIVYWLLSLF